MHKKRAPLSLSLLGFLLTNASSYYVVYTPTIMVRRSNCLLRFFKFLTLVISVAPVAASLWVSNHLASLSVCGLHVLVVNPLHYVGVSILVVSLLGLFGSCCRARTLRRIYLLVLFVGLACFTFLAIAMTNDYEAVVEKVSGKRYMEMFRLGDYSNWLQRYLMNGKHWRNIQRCLVDTEFCSGLGGRGGGGKVTDFAKRSLTLIQSGCCKPPRYCDLEFKNSTTAAAAAATVTQPDCATWSDNHQDALCHGCNSCKAGVLDNIKKECWLLAGFNIGLLVLVFFVFSMEGRRRSRKRRDYIYHVRRSYKC